MIWLLIGYMFLFIHRPFEIWPALGDMRIERIYMLVTLAFWATAAPKRLIPNLQQIANAGFATAVLVAWMASPWADKGQPVVEDYFKIVVFYVLLVTSVFTERDLKRIAIALLVVMSIYLTHSLREYLNGRHVFRMGIARLIGVDKTLGDPNSFGASIVFVLPFVAAMWRSGVGGRKGKIALIGYVGLSTLCILLTGSRSSLLGVGVWFAILILRGPKKWLWISFACLAAPAAFLALPESLQTRFETIVNPDAGPANAKESGEGRVQGFFTGMELWGRNPFSGIGPGAWRPATRSSIESHNLYGQVAGEMGTIGVATFAGVVACFLMNLLWVSRVKKRHPEWANDPVIQIPAAIGTSLFLLLFLGMFGHNLFRYSWLWYGGLLIISRYLLERRLRNLPIEHEVEESEEEYELEVALPEGWTSHEAHAPLGVSVDARGTASPWR